MTSDQEYTITVKDIPYTVIPIKFPNFWRASIYLDYEYLGNVQAESLKDSIRKAEYLISIFSASR